MYLEWWVLVRQLTMLRDRDTEALWNPVRTAALQQIVPAESLDKQFAVTYNTTTLLNLTLQWRWKFWRDNVILLAVRVLVEAVGVELFKVISTEIAVF